jgi:hypothetical protein
MRANFDVTRLNQVEGVSGFIFAKQMLVATGPERLGALGKPQPMLFFQVLGKAMARQGGEDAGVIHVLFSI